MDRRTMLRRIGAASGGIAAVAAGAGSAEPTLDGLSAGDTVTVDGDRLRVLGAASDGVRVRDVSGDEHNICCYDCDRDGCTYCVDCT
ncbi:MAG: hypothetical protein ABEI75_02840 [Halobaculum sp.]